MSFISLSCWIRSDAKSRSVISATARARRGVRENARHCAKLDVGDNRVCSERGRKADEEAAVMALLEERREAMSRNLRGQGSGVKSERSADWPNQVPLLDLDDLNSNSTRHRELCGLQLCIDAFIDQ